MKVLTVDDSRAIRLLIKKYLQPLNLEVVEAADGKQGLEAAQKEKPDLILLDINMPVMEGPEALAKLRKDSTTKDIPVIMLTADSAKEMIVKLLQTGISDYIVKPFDEQLLLSKVRKILKLDTQKRVLVLDDNESILFAAKKFLAGVANVFTANEPEKALQLASQQAPDVVFLDLDIPEVDVLEIFSTLRSETNLKSSRFIGLATKSMEEEIESARQAGLSEILMKPFDQDSLTKLVAG